MDLCSQSALVTAYNNDVSADAVYAQVLSVCAKQGDIFLGISTSGNAKNVKNAFLVAKAMGIKSILLTGNKGGVCAQLADKVIYAPESETYKIQEYHLPIYHHICLSVEKEMFGGKE
jgi:phosphoheptose isomerase